MDSDTKLIKQLAVGCPQAMEELIDRYGERLRRTIGQLTAWSPDVDDLLQETLVRAWKNASTLRDEGLLEKWLISIAFRVCRDHQRGLRRFLVRLNRFWTERHLLNNTPVPIVETDKWEHLQHAMAKLSPDDRHLLVMKYLEAWSSEELADQLGVTTQTLHVRLHRAKNRLRQLVHDHE